MTRPEIRLPNSKQLYKLIDISNNIKVAKYIVFLTSHK
jgi:hypothetical protein